MVLNRDPDAKLEIELANLPKTNVTELRSLYTSSINPNFRGKYKAVEAELQGIISNKYQLYQRNYYKDSIDGEAAELMREYADRVDAEETPENVLQEMKQRLGIKPKAPVAPDGTELNTKESIQVGNAILQKLKQQEGANPAEIKRWSKVLFEGMKFVSEGEGE